MSQPVGMSESEQFQALNTISYLEDLFTIATKETFSRDEILMLLNRVKTDPEIFDPQVVIAHQIACDELEALL